MLLFIHEVCAGYCTSKKNPIHEGDVILLISNDNTWDIASLIFFILRQQDKARDYTKNATSRIKKISHEIVFFFPCAKYNETKLMRQ